MIRDEASETDCQNFVDYELNNAKPTGDGEDGLRVLYVLDAAQDSLESDSAPVAMVEANLNKRSL